MVHLRGLLAYSWVCNLPFFADASAASQMSLAMDNKQVAVCTIAAGNGVDALFDSGIKVFQSVKQCNAMEKDLNDHNLVACAADIGEIIASVADLAQYVINIVSACAGKKTPHSACIQYGFALVGSISQLASSVGDLDLQCLHKTRPYHDTLTCLFDVKFGVHELLSVLEHGLVLKDLCTASPTYCAAGVFDVLASVGNLANYVLASLGNCETVGNLNLACGTSIAKLSASIAEIVASAINAAKTCKPIPSAIRSSAAAPAVTPAPPPSVVTDFMKWAKKEQAKGIAPAALKGDVTAAISRNLTQVSKLFSNRRRDLTEEKEEFLEDKFSFVPFLAAGAIPVALLLGFSIGRRTVARPSARVTHTYQRPDSCPDPSADLDDLADLCVSSSCSPQPIRFESAEYCEGRDRHDQFEEESFM
jgi:hypothetical protein